MAVCGPGDGLQQRADPPGPGPVAGGHQLAQRVAHRVQGGDLLLQLGQLLASQSLGRVTVVRAACGQASSESTSSSEKPSRWAFLTNRTLATVSGS
jgi:hypothetical protein